MQQYSGINSKFSLKTTALLIKCSIFLGIFGSVARKENAEDSDIDIVVEVQKPSLQLMYELKEALKQLFDCEVDLVRFRDSLRPLLKSNIERDAIYV